MKVRFLALATAASLVLTCLILSVPPSHAKLVAYWPLDEGTGEEIKDATGNGYDGTFTGNPTWTDGMYGKGLEFGGKDYVDVPKADEIKPESITMETWVYFSDVSGRQDFISRNDDYALSLGGNPTDGKIWAVITTAGDWLDVGGGTKVETGRWYHTAMVYNAGTKKLTIYLDGEKDGEGSAPAGIEHRFGGSLTIGTYRDRYLKGKLDDIKIWDNVLSQQEIKDSMKAAPVEYAGKLATTWGEIKGK